ncbi:MULTISPECIES: hypothetical protein [Flavobacterium]|uniref:hypothetical protein n=1 Tax=Flavobacterium TaxID=237 RepID=UPI001FCBFA61|nr:MULTISPECIES: hypothetical protein [Flavobacterium]UOK42205.1 hypothetical protein LZF87_12910 [Flavobacterium enshiense]
MEWFGNKYPQLLKAGGTLAATAKQNLIIITFKMEKTQKLNTLTNKNLFLAFITLLVLNAICVITLAKKTGAYNLDGTYSEANSSELLITAVIGTTVSIPLVCAILSSIIAIFINRKQPYGKRFVKTFLFTSLIVFSFSLIRFIMNIFSM